MSENKDEYFDKVIGLIKESLEGLQYGTVTLIIQDGKVIQIDKSEKRRIK